LRLFCSFGGYGLALAALALVVFGAYDSYPELPISEKESSRKNTIFKKHHKCHKHNTRNLIHIHNARVMWSQRPLPREAQRTRMLYQQTARKGARSQQSGKHQTNSRGFEARLLSKAHAAAEIPRSYKE